MVYYFLLENLADGWTNVQLILKIEVTIEGRQYGGYE